MLNVNLVNLCMSFGNWMNLVIRYCWARIWSGLACLANAIPLRNTDLELSVDHSCFL